MVTFIPPYMGEEIKSNAEKKMFDVLQHLEVEDAFVLHSLGLPKHQSKTYLAEAVAAIVTQDFHSLDLHY